MIAAAGTLFLIATGGAGISDQEIARLVSDLGSRLTDTRREIHAHPELANREYRAGKLVAGRLRELGLEVQYPVAKTGVLGYLRGAKPGPVVALRAELDALPIEERSDVSYRSRVGGAMHACGHDAHVAIVLGAAEVLSRLSDRLSGGVVFLFQPAEEGPPVAEEGGAGLVLKEGVLEAYRVRAFLGLHVDALLDVGRVGYTEGVVFGSRDSFEIEVLGRVAHGADPGRGIDAILIAAELVQALRRLAEEKAGEATVTVGRIRGGDHPNLVAGQARLEGTLRARRETLRGEIKDRMAELVRGTAAARGGRAELRFRGEGVPALRNDAGLARLCLPTLKRLLGVDGVVPIEPGAGSDDFALYSGRYPGLYLMLGVRNEAKGITAAIHSDRFDVDEDALGIGVRILVTVVIEELAETGR